MESASSKNILGKINHALHLDHLAPGPRRIVVSVVGGTLLLIGVALIFLPGPAFVVIPAGVAVLASEFAWARRYFNKAEKLLKKAKTKAKQTARGVQR
jgi:hypothetical protein